MKEINYNYKRSKFSHTYKFPRKIEQNAQSTGYNQSINLRNNKHLMRKN